MRRYQASSESGLRNAIPSRSLTSKTTRRAWSGNSSSSSPTIAGGTIAALTGGEFTNEWLPPMWVARFGDSIALRAVVALGGGVLMAIGARLAGGCTSGHGISGTLQLNLASWIAVVCFFIGGIAVAMLLFKL